MENEYAHALAEMIEKGMSPAKAVGELHKTLLAHGREALLPRIGRAFARIAARKRLKSELRLTVATEGDARQAEREAKATLTDLDVDSADLETVVDGSLIGGWRLEGRERLVDASYKKYLLDIYHRATGAV
ncbi:MAG: F0F1 ATP synthase subunit delta [Candidatus Kaiserbacteria bacterium]|nr:MAG: F0F1 ATP synthase subunit delta [Candidatus Kaiserbacteria bacterium]